jgi:hypothetical protein
MLIQTKVIEMSSTIDNTQWVKCPCTLPRLDFHAELREDQVHSVKNAPTL